MPIHLAISGATGRMGKRLIYLASEANGGKDFQVTAALDAPHCIALGQDAGTFAGWGTLNVPITTSLDATASPPNVLIDFSAPAAPPALIPQCVDRNIGKVNGTTRRGAPEQQLIDDDAKSIPILQATNSSLGVNVLLLLAAQVARQLGDAYDIEIVEAHHNQKKDAPSGTALSLAESICKATGRDLHKDLVHGREGLDAQRSPRSIGMHAVRMGDVVGEHTLYFATPGERIEIKHVASTRDTFARGALRAAAFIATSKPGRYAMKDVLGL
jgi:4-hydroxy-tetrahydrodipicolinate reductase